MKNILFFSNFFQLYSHLLLEDLDIKESWLEWVKKILMVRKNKQKGKNRKRNESQERKKEKKGYAQTEKEEENRKKGKE